MNTRKRIITLVVALAFVIVGINQVALAADAKKKPNFKQYHSIVDLAFVEKVASGKTKGVLIDSRPVKTKFDKGHIPGSVSLPTSKFDKMIDRLPKDKNTLVIFYCGGLHCALSHKGAFKAEKLGYKNVKVFAEGYPAWTKVHGPGPYTANYKIYNQLATAAQVKEVVDGKKLGLVIDARPKKTKYDKGHIPGAVSIPDSQFDKMKGLLPADKNAELVFYCGGLHCALSHKSAFKAASMGYKNIKVYADGFPGWKKAYGAPETATAKADAKEAPKTSDMKYKAGPEEGSIDVAVFKDLVKAKVNDVMLIDVRDANEFKACHYKGAVNIPTEELEKKLPKMKVDKPVVFVCSTGARSGEAYYMVKDMRPDIKEVYYVDATIESDGNGSCKVTKKKAG